MPSLPRLHPAWLAVVAALCGHGLLVLATAPQPREQRVRPPGAQLRAQRAAWQLRPSLASIAQPQPQPQPVRVAAAAVSAAKSAAPSVQVRAGMAMRLAAGATPAGTASASMPVAASAVIPPPVPVPATSAAPAAAAASVEPAAAAPLAALPRLRLPPAAQLRFVAIRGNRSGQAELRWEQPDALHYDLLLVLRYDGEGQDALIQSSRGSLGPQGLQPRRYADRRARSGLRAAEFDDEESAPAVGAQDRLSWLVQLVAIAAARPAPPSAGERIVLPVADTRGDLRDWVFESLGEVAPGDGLPPCVHLSRAPLHRYDWRIDLWFDARHPGWPLRLRWSHPAREAITLTLADPNAAQQR